MKLVIMVLVICGFAFGNFQNRCRSPCLPSDYYRWSIWSSCSASCGYNGQRTRFQYNYECYDHSWRWCKVYQTESCNRKCCPVACSYYYTAWSSCAGCGNHGTQSRRLVIRSQPSCGGRACPGAGIHFRQCDTGR